MPDRINTPFTNEHFAAFCLSMLGQPYWYGTALHKCSESLRASKARQYPSHYKRKTTHGKAAWQCSTFITLGKRFCHTKQIPEDILIATTVSVLGIAEFDEEVFLNQIERIEVPAFNHLVYIIKDGHREERIWQDKSRRDSWTDEMREQARRRNQK